MPTKLMLKAISNTDLWNAIRAKYPNFRTQTSEGTAELFSERGWTAITRDGLNVVNDFYNLSLRVYLQLLTTAEVRDTLNEQDFGEYFSNEYGEISQRIAINSIKPVTPAYRNLIDGTSVDPFVIRKPTSSERFFRTNFDYQSLVSLTDEWNIKNMFLNEYGVSQYMAGIMQGLANGYTVQLYVNKLEALNAGMNSTVYPLRDSQVYTVSLSSTPTADELKNLVRAIRYAIEALQMGPSTSAFNQMGFDSYQDISRMRLLIRPGMLTDIGLDLLSNTFHVEYAELGVQIVRVPHFGGLIPFTDNTYATRLYEVYSPLGEMIGYNTVEGSTTVTVPTEDAVYQDPNVNTVAVLADKGIIFNTQMNPYTVESIRNPRGLYTNYWANSPNNAINYDHMFNLIRFVKTA